MVELMKDSSTAAASNSIFQTALEDRPFHHVAPTASGDFEMTWHGSSPRDPLTDMTTTSKFKITAAQRCPNMRTPRKPRIRKAKSPGLNGPNAKNAQRNYERYLALARAEALSGDRITAENYFQHAEHYLRSMHESRSAAGADARHPATARFGSG
jgi:hypothetical protein